MISANGHGNYRMNSKSDRERHQSYSGNGSLIVRDNISTRATEVENELQH